MRWKRAEGEHQYCDGACSVTLVLPLTRKKGALRTRHMHWVQTSEKQINDIGYEPAPEAESGRLAQDAAHD